MDRAQLIALGLTSDAIDRRTRTGRLHILHRGVYAVGHPAVTERGRALAALRAGGPRAHLSHGSAAWAWRIADRLEDPLELSLTSGARRSRAGVTIHRTRLQAGDVGARAGLRVTTPLRTLTDLGTSLTGRRFERLCSEAAFLKLVTAQQLEAAGLVPAAPTRSELEVKMLELVRAAGLPLPQVNRPLPPFTPDFTWPEERVIVETDGWEAHGHRLAFERDRARDAVLHANGYVVLRFTWRQLNEEPFMVVARIAQVLAQRRTGQVPRAPLTATGPPP